MPKQIPFPAASRGTGTYNSAVYAVNEDSSLACYVTATSGAGSVIVRLQESDDGGTTWADSVTSSSIASGQSAKISVTAPCTGTIRVNAVVATVALSFRATLIYSGSV